MTVQNDVEPQMPSAVAGAIASAAFVVPLALSASSAPSPNHLRILLWYRSLRQPPFKPPDWMIPLAWAGIEATTAFSAYRLLRAPKSAARSKALGLWSWNVMMIGAWNRLFFKNQSLPVSTLAAAGLVVTSAAFIKQAQIVDRPAARAGVPLSAWVAFATALTAPFGRSIGAAERRVMNKRPSLTGSVVKVHRPV